MNVTNKGQNASQRIIISGTCPHDQADHTAPSFLDFQNYSLPPPPPYENVWMKPCDVMFMLTEQQR